MTPEQLKTIKGYKFIQENMTSRNGNHKWELRKWYKEKDIRICERGFHACKTAYDSLEYIYGDKWFLVEARGKIVNEDDKFVAQEMRLVKELPADKILKRWAIWCAKQSLKNYEKVYPNDKRPSNAIKAAEDYLDGKIDIQELNNKISAARSAAESAESARSAARSAAWSAAESARSAARSAAWSAAESARSAAWSAAESARSAAESAESARSAARSAESAQKRVLNRIIKEVLNE